MINRNSIRLIFLITVFVVVFAESRAHAQDVFHGLSDLPGGNFDSYARAISPDGNIIVGSGLVDDGQRGFRWTEAGGMSQLNGAFNGITFALGVSDTGRIVGVSPGLVGNTFATYWNSDGSFGGGLGDLPGGGDDSIAFGVSADGSTIVGWGTSAAGQEAFRWTAATGMVGSGVPDSLANAISSDGSTTVGRVELDGNYQAFRWNNENFDVLGSLPGYAPQSTAHAVSANGSVIVGRSGLFGEDSEAFRWTAAEGMVGLGQLSGTDINQSATAVSADGSIIVGRSGDGFIWDPQQGMRRLLDVMTNDFGMDTSDWSILKPTAISADGLTIVGYGQNVDTQYSQYAHEAFRISVDARWIRNASGQWNDRSNWAFGINPNELHDLMITPTTGLMVTKSSGTSTIRSLDLNATTGTATLNLQNSTVNVLNQTTIGNGGRLTGNAGGTFNAVGGISNLGTIDLGTGLQVTGGTINNQGLVRGDGEIASDLQNTDRGEIRVGPGQHMRLTGTSSFNSGLIDVTGGSFEISRSFVNEGESALIYARDASLRFNGGLANGGELGGAIGISFGTTDIYGEVNNQISGVINISGGANVTFVDDLNQNGIMEVVRVGDTVSKAVIFGEFSGSGGFVGGGDVFALGDLRPGNSPASVLMDGNLYFGSGTDSYFELGGLLTGEFDQIVVTGELGLAGDLSVALLDEFQLSIGDEFLIGDVFGDVSGQFRNLGEGDLVGNFGALNLHITYAAGTGNDIALFTTAVPEPSGLFIIGGFAIGFCVFPRRRAFVVSEAHLTTQAHDEQLRSS